MPPFTTPRQMGGGFAIDKLMMDSPLQFTTQKQISIFRNGVGSCGGVKSILNKKIDKRGRKLLR